MKWPAILIALLFVTSCSATGAGSAECSWVRPLRLSDETIKTMSDQEVNDVVVHNRMWRLKCETSSS